MNKIILKVWNLKEKCWITGKQPDNDDVFFLENKKEESYEIGTWNLRKTLLYSGYEDDTGDRLFEGDVVETEDKTRYVVIRDKSGAFLFNTVGFGDTTYQVWNNHQYVRKIGNIYPNPELNK